MKMCKYPSLVFFTKIKIVNIFGENNVHDFSGISKITNNYKNYYENSHYRTNVTKDILKTVYSK